MLYNVSHALPGATHHMVALRKLNVILVGGFTQLFPIGGTRRTKISKLVFTLPKERVMASDHMGTETDQNKGQPEVAVCERGAAQET